jgi:hypothetical protein
MMLFGMMRAHGQCDVNYFPGGEDRMAILSAWTRTTWRTFYGPFSGRTLLLQRPTM